MLAMLLGSVNKERVLVYLASRRRGYAREIARFFGAPLYPIQRAMESLEAAGVLCSRSIGKTREFEWNQRYPARRELAGLVERGLSLYPRELRERLRIVRTRPRRKGKPL